MIGMTGEVETIIPLPLPAEIADPREAEQAVRKGKAILDVMRRGRADLKKQVQIIRRIVEICLRGAGLIEDMRARGELAEHGDGQLTAEVRRSKAILTLEDLDLDHRRVSEWFSLRDHNALAFIDEAIKTEREATWRKASLNWIRERVERISREHAAASSPSNPDYHSEIRFGDMRTALDDLAGTVDAIVTDPPYPEEFLGEFDALSEVAARLLKPGGILVAMVGQTHLPQYLERLSRHLTYRWCCAYLVAGSHARVFGRSFATMWKPLLVFDRNQERRFITRDLFYSVKPDKSVDGQISGWGQSETGMLDIVEHLTQSGELVVDPFMGAGTTGIACKQLGRRFVGCDNDPDAVRIARERLGV